MAEKSNVGLYGLFIALAILALPQLAAASNCGTVPSSISSLIVSCIPFNIVNTQATATPVGFQQQFATTFTYNTPASPWSLNGPIAGLGGYPQAYSSNANMEEPTVLYEGNAQLIDTTANVFKIWYRSSTQTSPIDQIDYAESLNGITWVNYPGNAVLQCGSAAECAYPQVFENNGIYYLYAENPNSASAGTIAVWNSINGIAWNLITANALTPSGWDGSSVGAGGVWVYNGLWYMLYGAGTSLEYIGLATSTNGITWTHDGSAPVIKGVNGNGDGMSGGATVLNISNTIYAWYQCGTNGGSSPTDVCRASAAYPFTTWTYSPSNPVEFRTQPWEGSQYAEGQLSDPDLLEANGILYDFVMGVSNQAYESTSQLAELSTTLSPAELVAGPEMNQTTIATPVNPLPFNALSGNVVVYNGISGSLMPAWVENSSTLWVNLEGNTIASDSSANGIYYFGLGSSSTSFFSTASNPANGIGEAPQWSGSYAEYDNGNQIFPYYQRWGGLSALPSGWANAIGGGGNSVITFGTTNTEIAPGTNSGHFYGIYMPSPATFNTFPTAIDLYGNQYNPINAGSGTGLSSTDTSIGADYFLQEAVGTPYYLLYLTNYASQISTGYSDTNTLKTYTLSIASGASANVLINYSSVYGSTSLTSEPGKYYSVILGYGGGGKAAPIFLDWLRSRAYPPNGVMPTVSYGSMPSPASVPILSISPNPSTYGQSITLTATCSSGGTCDIDYPTQGTHIATGASGTAAYTYSAYQLGAGTYSSYYANDITGGVNSVAQTITVNQGTPSITLPSFPANFVYSGNSAALTANIVSYDNQLTANDFINNILQASFTTQNTISESSAGTYAFTANTLGNGNYLGSTNTLALLISQALTPLTWIAQCPTGIYLEPCTTTANILTYDNQLSASLYLGSTSTGSTTTQISNTIGAAGSYTYTFNTLGNGNYIANSIAYSFTQSALTPPSYISSNSFTIPYGGSTLLSATCSSGDTCNIIVAGIQVAASTTSVSYNFVSGNGGYGPGTYKIKFCDEATGSCTPDPYLFVTAPIYLQNSSENPAFTFSQGLQACEANTIGGFCEGNDVISGTQSLDSNLYVMGNVIVPSGVLTFNGYMVESTISFNSVGASIIGGNELNGGSGTGGVCTEGGNLPLSYGGSGGGGNHGAGTACNGGSTLVPGGLASVSGNGATPSAATLSNSIIQGWVNNGIGQYISGAGGGGFVHVLTPKGGSGTFGILLISPTISLGTCTTNAPTEPYWAGGGGAGSIYMIYATSFVGSCTAVGATSLDSGGTGGNGNIIKLNSGIMVAPIVEKVVYPFELYFSSTSLTYTLNSVVGATQTTLQGPTNALAWQTLNSVQPSGIYNFSVVESNGVSSYVIPINLSVNMADIASSLTFTGACSNPMQFFTNCANVPVWNAKPTQWEILGSQIPMQNTTGATNIDYFSNATKMFYPLLFLTYNQFTPTISFIANAINNPAITDITQNGFAITLTNTPLSTNRTVAQFNIFSQYTFNQVDTNLSVKVNGSFNGYTVNAIASATGNSIYFMQIPNSIYNNNPPFSYQLNDSASTPLYYAHADTYCYATVNQTDPEQFYPVGLVDTNGSKYSFYIYTAGGAQAAGYIMQVLEQKGVGSTQVQSFLIPNQYPAVLALEATGQSYAFDVFNRACTQAYYKGAFTVPSNPVYFTLNNTQGGLVLNITKANGLCKIDSLTSNTYHVTCEAGDSSNNAYEYRVYVYQAGSVLAGSELVYNYTAIGSSFIDNFTLPAVPPIPQYSATIYAYIYKSSDPIISLWSYLLNPANAAQLAPSLLGLIAFIIMLVLMLGGATTGKIMIFLMLCNVGVFLIGLFNLVTVPLEVEVFFIVLSCICIWYEWRTK